MVKQREKNNRKKSTRKGFKKNRARARKISASTGFDTCTEQLSPFGGLLGLIKFLDLVDFAKIFDSAYIVPRRDPKLGHYSMVVGILMLLFIGFNRICHFVYVQLDAMLCGFFKGHNTKNRGKKGYRPVLGFIDQTREYIAGKLRAGETIIMIVFTSPWVGRSPAGLWSCVYPKNKKVKYSIHDARTPLMIHFLNFLDEARNKPKAWMEDGGWPQNFAIA